MSKGKIRSIDDLRAAVEELSATDNESFLKRVVEIGRAARILLTFSEAASTKAEVDVPQYDQFGEGVVALLQAYRGRWVRWDVLDAKLSFSRDFFGADYEIKFNKWQDLWKELSDPRIGYEELSDGTERWRYIDDSTEVSNDEQSVKSENFQRVGEAVVARAADAPVDQPKPRASAQKPAIQKPEQEPGKPKNPEKPKPTRLGPIPKKKKRTRTSPNKLYSTGPSKTSGKTITAVKPSVQSSERATGATAPETTLTNWGLWRKDYGRDRVGFYVNDKLLRLDPVATQILELLLRAEEPVDLRYLHRSVKLEPSDRQDPTVQEAVSKGLQDIKEELNKVEWEHMLKKHTETENGSKRTKYQLTGVLRQTTGNAEEGSSDFLER